MVRPNLRVSGVVSDVLEPRNSPLNSLPNIDLKTGGLRPYSTVVWCCFWDAVFPTFWCLLLHHSGQLRGDWRYVWSIGIGLALGMHSVTQFVAEKTTNVVIQPASSWIHCRTFGVMLERLNVVNDGCIRCNFWSFERKNKKKAG